MNSETRTLPQFFELRNRVGDYEPMVLEVQANDQGAVRFILNGRQTLSVLSPGESKELGRWLLQVEGS